MALGELQEIGDRRSKSLNMSAQLPFRKFFLSVICILFKRGKSPLIRFVFVVRQRFDDDGRSLRAGQVAFDARGAAQHADPRENFRRS